MNIVICLIIQFLIGIFLIIQVNAGVQLTYISDNVDGTYRGKVIQSDVTDKYHIEFKGIPYAKPPIEELRFKAPVPIDPLTSVYEGFEFQSECLQKSIDGKTIKGSEDCLYLNIYTPAEINIKPDLYPVMFYIHGGAFIEGSGNDIFYGPDFLLENQNVILVTFNYRLGPLGFMSLGTIDYSGNMGLKDQLLALRWVNENIHRFRGDNSKITIFGHSAGSVSTHWHTIAPASQGLFQRAIMMSGSVLNEFSVSTSRIHIRKIFEFVKSMGGSTASFNNVVDFIKSVDANALIENLIDPLYISGEARKTSVFTWSPVIERGSHAFIDDFPENILNNEFKSDIDTMFGFTDAEMLFLTAEELRQPDLLKSFDEKLEIGIPKRGLNTDYDSQAYKKLATKIRSFYFGENGHINNDTLIQFNELLSDTVFVYGIDKSVKIQAKQSSGKTFYYRFAVEAELNVFRQIFNIPSYVPGASHGDELCYLFRCNVIPNLYSNIKQNSVEMSLIKNFTKLWINFATYGNPTPNGDPVNFEPITKDQDKINFLDIRNTGFSIGHNPHLASIKFWDKVIDEFERDVANSYGHRDEL